MDDRFLVFKSVDCSVLKWDTLFLTIEEPRRRFVLGVDVNVSFFGAVEEPASRQPFVSKVKSYLARPAWIVVTSTNDGPLRNDVLAVFILGSELESVVERFEKLCGLIDVADG